MTDYDDLFKLTAKPDNMKVKTPKVNEFISGFIEESALHRPQELASHCVRPAAALRDQALHISAVLNHAQG